MDVLRRGAGAEGSSPRRSLAALDDAGLWNAHVDVVRGLDECAGLAERLASSVARYRGSVDASAERAAGAGQRAESVGVSLSRIGEAFDKLSVVALNAGLEGARAEGGEGRSLSLVAAETRGHVGRGADAARELSSVVREVQSELAELRQRLDRVRAEASEIGQEAGRLGAALAQVRTANQDVAARIRKVTGIDPEIARVVTQAAEHARGLMAALSALTTAGGGALVKSALGPVMAPLGRMLVELGVGASAGAEDPEAPPGSEAP